MRRHRTAAYLPKQSAFVEVIEDFPHLSAGNAGRPIPFQTDSGMRISNAVMQLGVNRSLASRNGCPKNFILALRI
jgi:hypothetical protein